MTLDQALQEITHCFEAMNAAYAATLFDEYLILARKNDGKYVLLNYEGPRSVEIRTQMQQDSRVLRAMLGSVSFEPGDFEFARHAEGAYFDGVMQIGPVCYLLFSHTGKSMHDLTQDPNWKKAQVSFVDLSERFRLDPLVLV